MAATQIGAVRATDQLQDDLYSTNHALNIFQGTNFDLELSKGNIPGHSFINKFGENPNILTADNFVDIWPGTTIGSTQKYVPPTVARTHNVASSSIEDAGTLVTSGNIDSGVAGPPGSLNDADATFEIDSVGAGDLVLNDTQTVLGSVVLVVSETSLLVNAWFNPTTGRRDVDPVAGDAYRIVSRAATGTPVTHLLALDSSFLTVEEFVINNGTTVVATANELLRVNRCREFGAVSVAGNIGTVTATAQTDNTISMGILPGDNQTLQALYTVAFDEDAYLQSWKCAISKKTAGTVNFRLRLGELDGSVFVTDIVSLNTSGTTAQTIPMSMERIPGGTDVLVEGDSGSNNMGGSGGFRLVRVDVGTP